jgi:nucleoside-diphosphate kinase
MQRTLILLKPDCVQRRFVGTITRRFEQKGLRLVGLKLVQASRALAEKHYAVHKGKPFYDSLLQFLTSGPTVAMVWEGREAVAVARTLMGATDGTKAPPATIRGDFALSVQNRTTSSMAAIAPKTPPRKSPSGSRRSNSSITRRPTRRGSARILKR